MSLTEPNHEQPGRYRVALRWGDMDALGHVNQAAYHELLEEARSALVASLPTYDKQSFVLAHISLDFRHEIPLHHRFVEVELRIQTVGQASIALTQRIFRSDGELAADGRSVMVAWDSSRRRSRPLNDQELAALRAMIDAQAG